MSRTEQKRYQALHGPLTWLGTGGQDTLSAFKAHNRLAEIHHEEGEDTSSGMSAVSGGVFMQAAGGPLEQLPKDEAAPAYAQPGERSHLPDECYNDAEGTWSPVTK